MDGFSRLSSLLSLLLKSFAVDFARVSANSTSECMTLMCRASADTQGCGRIRGVRENIIDGEMVDVVNVFVPVIQ